MGNLQPFNDLINLIAHLAPEQVLAFKPSTETIERVKWLLEKEKESNISSEEKEELELYMIQEELMIVAKARAKLQIGQHESENFRPTA